MKKKKKIKDLEKRIKVLEDSFRDREEQEYQEKARELKRAINNANLQAFLASCKSTVGSYECFLLKRGETK